MESIFWEILDMLPTAVYILNQDGTFRFINKAAEELDALRRDEIIGKQAFQIYQSIYLGEETISPGITALHTGKSIENINLEWYCNGKRNNALTSAYPIVKEGETVGAVIFCDPVSSLKRRLIQNISFMKKSTIKLRHKQLKNGTEPYRLQKGLQEKICRLCSAGKQALERNCLHRVYIMPATIMQVLLSR